MKTIRSYGTLLSDSSSSEIQECIEQVNINGFYVAEGLFSENELTEMRVRLDAVYQTQVKEFGEANLLKIGELNLARCLLDYDQWFLTIATNPLILKIITYFLGEYFILNLQNGIINHPSIEHHQSAWHRDLPYQSYVSSKPLAMNALICVDKFSEETGATMLVPRSHKLEALPSQTYLEKFAMSVEAPPGSALFFDSMLFHRAGSNSSQSLRRAINQMYTIPIIKQQVNFSDRLSTDCSQDPFLVKLLGFDSLTPNSVNEWRQKRLSRKQALAK